MARHHLGKLVGISCALVALAVACGPDNDILLPQNSPPPPANTDTTDDQNPDPNATDPDTDNDSNPDDDLDDADQLASDPPPSECDACPTPPNGAAACCTTAADVTAVTAMAAGECGADMSAFGFPGCIQLDQPGVLDDSCPPVEFPPGAPPMPGCCTAAGVCGAMETFMGFGCTTSPDSSTWVPCGG